MELERYSVVGRPRRLRESQIALILDWHRNRTSMRELARQLRVSESTIRNVIRTQGAGCKQPPPERRAAVLRVARLRREVRDREGPA